MTKKDEPDNYDDVLFAMYMFLVVVIYLLIK